MHFDSMKLMRMMCRVKFRVMKLTQLRERVNKNAIFFYLFFFFCMFSFMFFLLIKTT